MAEALRRAFRGIRTPRWFGGDGESQDEEEDSDDDHRNVEQWHEMPRTKSGREQRPNIKVVLHVTMRMMVACGCCACSFGILFLCAVLYVAWAQVCKGYNLDSWHDARIPPDEFPRYMGCAGCNPGVKTDAEIDQCASPCYNSSLIVAMERFNREHGYSLVFFPSRHGIDGEVNISAWWLPADTSRLPPGRIPPRVVVLHGLASNNNHCGVQNACYLLRSMGFSCLTPSIRDYGLSGPSKHPGMITWGAEYVVDVLGAWDYAVKDPNGLMGGPLPESQVGIMGFSKGALTVTDAFGQENRVPAAWIDSAPIGLYSLVDDVVRPHIGFMTPLVRDPVSWLATWLSGAEWEKHTSAYRLADCHGPARKVAVSMSMVDDVVNPAQGNKLITKMGGRPDCYDVSMIYTPNEVCNGQKHHTAMWQFTERYRERLCTFWSGVFNQSTLTCGLDQLPNFHEPPYRL